MILSWGSHFYLYIDFHTRKLKLPQITPVFFLNIGPLRHNQYKKYHILSFGVFTAEMIWSDNLISTMRFIDKTVFIMQKGPYDLVASVSGASAI